MKLKKKGHALIINVLTNSCNGNMNVFYGIITSTLSLYNYMSVHESSFKLKTKVDAILKSLLFSVYTYIYYTREQKHPI